MTPNTRDRDELREALSAEPAGTEPFIELGNGERVSGSVAAYRAMHPFGPICGVIWPGGPNGEPLACGYPQNPPGEPMHEHSWAWVPTPGTTESTSDTALSAAAWREMFAAVGAMWAELLEHYDLAEDAQPGDVIEAADLRAALNAVPPEPSPTTEAAWDEAWREMNHDLATEFDVLVDRIASVVARHRPLIEAAIRTDR